MFEFWGMQDIYLLLSYDSMTISMLGERGREKWGVYECVFLCEGVGVCRVCQELCGGVFFPAASGHWACVAEILSLGGLLLTPTLMMETLWMYVLKCCVFLCVHVSVCVCTCAWCVCVNCGLIAPWTRNRQPVPSPNEPWSSGDGVWMTLNDDHMCVCLYVCVRVCIFESVVCVVQMVS